MKIASKTSPKILLSGGGTGGHIYPAIAIADGIKERLPNAEFLFVGALGKMEMEKVPKAGYPIKGLPIRGIDRSSVLSNWRFPFIVINSLFGARKIINDFKPDLAIGTGGYASGPTLWMAARKNIPIVLQEQNAFAGWTNIRLAKKASLICVAYEGMEKYFPAENIQLTGNPIRNKLFDQKPSKEEARAHFGLDEKRPTILSIGGSQGSRQINNAWKNRMDQFLQGDAQLIWQCGSLDYPSLSTMDFVNNPKVHMSEFIYEMDLAYAAADLVVSRAGAIAISELAALSKACLLIPLPWAAEDHQTKNAEYLVERDAGYLLADKDALENLVPRVFEILNDPKGIENAEINIQKIGRPNATDEIVNHILTL